MMIMLMLCGRKQHGRVDVTPSARSGYVLDPNLKIDKTDTLESDQKKEKMLPQEQREIAALRPKSSFKKLPTGWTREKVARAYNDAPLKETVYLTST